MSLRNDAVSAVIDSTRSIGILKTAQLVIKSDQGGWDEASASFAQVETVYPLSVIENASSQSLIDARGLVPSDETEYLIPVENTKVGDQVRPGTFIRINGVDLLVSRVQPDALDVTIVVGCKR